MTTDEAKAALGLHSSEAIDEPKVRLAHRQRAASVHPDAGGSDEEMRKVNEAREVLLEELGRPKVTVPCVCKGFHRNPLCKARHEDDEEREEGSTEPAAGCVCRGLFRNPLCKAH